MKTVCIVRRIDNLGRIIIPKEVRRTFRIREGDHLEIFVEPGGEIIMKKYSPISELSSFAKEYAECLSESIGHIACIADRDQIIAVSGGPKKEFLNKRIGAVVEKVMDERKAVLVNQPEQQPYYTIFAEEECRFTAEVIAPIIVEGTPIGAVLIVSREPNIKFGDLELKSAKTAASFLAKQMEQ